MYAKQKSKSDDLIHETLEGLGGVTLAKGHEGKFEKAERCGDCCLLDVFRMDRDLMVSSYQVDLRKGGAAGKSVGVILDVWDWIPVRDGPSVKGSIVSTDLPTAFLLWHEIEGGRTRALGSTVGAVP